MSSKMTDAKLWEYMLEWGEQRQADRITELEAGLQAIIDHQRIVGGDNYMSLSTTANIAKAALAKHKGEK